MEYVNTAFWHVAVFVKRLIGEFNLLICICRPVMKRRIIFMARMESKAYVVYVCSKLSAMTTERPPLLLSSDRSNTVVLNLERGKTKCSV